MIKFLRRLENQLESIDKFLAFTVFVFTLTIAYFSFRTGYALFNNLQFTSDGLHCYSSIRNFAFHLTTYEGPTFEYILGNHGYFLNFLLAPVIRIVPSPYVLCFINTLSHFVTALFLYLSGTVIIKSEMRYFLSALVAALYVVFPSVVDGYFFEVYMFQPDCFLAPELAILFYLVVRKPMSIKAPLIIGILIILTKEEYIPFIPIYYLLIYSYVWIMNQYDWLNLKLSLRHIAKMMGAFLITAILSLSAMKYFRSLNENNYLVRHDYDFYRLTELKSYVLSIQDSWAYLLPIAPIFLLLVITRRILPAATFVFWVFSFVAGRLLLNQVLYYGNSAGTEWGNIVIAPVLFISILFLMENVLRKKPGLKRVVCVSLTLMASIHLSAEASKKSLTYRKIQEYRREKLLPNFNLNEVSLIREKIPSEQKFGYFVSEEFLMTPFLERSHVSTNWLLWKGVQLNINWKIIRHADFLLLRKKGKFLKYIHKHPKFSTTKFENITETENLILLRVL